MSPSHRPNPRVFGPVSVILEPGFPGDDERALLVGAELGRPDVWHAQYGLVDSRVGGQRAPDGVAHDHSVSDTAPHVGRRAEHLLAAAHPPVGRPGGATDQPDLEVSAVNVGVFCPVGTGGVGGLLGNQQLALDRDHGQHQTILQEEPLED